MCSADCIAHNVAASGCRCQFGLGGEAADELHTGELGGGGCAEGARESGGGGELGEGTAGEHFVGGVCCATWQVRSVGGRGWEGVLC